jgi:hypothetical protein
MERARSMENTHRERETMRKNDGSGRTEPGRVETVGTTTSTAT